MKQSEIKFADDKVAIVIALYNDQDNIERAIRSAADQCLPGGFSLDIIVVDDCSTDGSYEIAKSVCAEIQQVRVLQLEQNGGPSCARNEALRHTDAAWYMPLDSDDALDPERLTKLLKTAGAEQADIVADNLLITHSDHPFDVVRTLWPSKPPGLLNLSAEFFVRHCYGMPEERSELGYLKPLISRKILADPTAPYRPDLRFAEDYELYTRLLLDGAKAVLTDGFGYYFIQRDFSSSRSQAGDEHRKIVMIDREFLKRSNLTEEEQKAIKGHLEYSKTEWANWTVIDAVRERNLGKLFSAFQISRSAILFLLKVGFRKLTSNKTESAGSK